MIPFRQGSRGNSMRGIVACILALALAGPALASGTWQMSCRGADYKLTYRSDIAELIMTQPGKEPTRWPGVNDEDANGWQGTKVKAVVHFPDGRALTAYFENARGNSAWEEPGGSSATLTGLTGEILARDSCQLVSIAP
jgi:hypothetical protein